MRCPFPSGPPKGPADAQALDVQADVPLGPGPAGGFRLTGIKLRTALTGVDITLDAALES